MKLRTARPVARLRQGRTDWYRISNHAGADGAAAEVYIYDEIGYWGVTAKDFVDELRQVTADRIDLHLNSPGGDVFDGIAIYNALRQHRASVTTYVDALAVSAASFIAMAGDRVVMARNAEMMIHDAWGLAIGNAADMRDMAERLDKISDNIADIYMQHAGGTVEDWRAAMLAETWYSADEAVAAGLADEVQSGSGTADGAGNSFDLSVFTYAGRREAPAPPAAAARQRPARPAPAPAPAAPVQEPAAPAAPWDRDLAEMFRASMAEHVQNAPAPPAPPEPDPVPAPPPGDTFVIDPIEFRNFVREGIHARHHSA